MASSKKKVELFIDINTEKDFDHALNQYKNKLICAELYSSYFGSCVALDRLFTKFKLEWSLDEVILLKVLVDEIKVLERFQAQSEPVYMFIVNKRATKVYRGVNSIELEAVAKNELSWYRREMQDPDFARATYPLDQATPDERAWISLRLEERRAEDESFFYRRAVRQAARKRHRAELMVPHLKNLNFVLFWPHAKHAHPELYERWDANNIIMIAREEIELDEEKARDVLYAGDAPLNEASLHMLLAGPALAICFRCLDDDKDFVALARSILYEEIPPLDESKPMRDQPPQMTAFDYYKSYSPTRAEIYRKRKEDKKKRRAEYLENRKRRLSEMQRLARQAREEAAEAKKAAKEKFKMDALKSGNLAALDNVEDEGEEIDIPIPEELSDELEEESSGEEDENEYFPPPGLLVPGFYAPPNEVAKANGLALLFPGVIHGYVTPQEEFLPPHLLVMLPISKRHKAIDAMTKHLSAVIHMGIFKATTPFDAVHVAYTVKQYESMHLDISEEDLKIAFMISIERDIPMLELIELHPTHVSRDAGAGEDECAAFVAEYANSNLRKVVREYWETACQEVWTGRGSVPAESASQEVDTGCGWLYRRPWARKCVLAVGVR